MSKKGKGSVRLDKKLFPLSQSLRESSPRDKEIILALIISPFHQFISNSTSLRLFDRSITMYGPTTSDLTKILSQYLFVRKILV